MRTILSAVLACRFLRPLPLRRAPVTQIRAILRSRFLTRLPTNETKRALRLSVHSCRVCAPNEEAAFFERHSLFNQPVDRATARSHERASSRIRQLHGVRNPQSDHHHHFRQGNASAVQRVFVPVGLQPSSFNHALNRTP